MYGEITPEEIRKINEESKALHDKPCSKCESVTESHYCPYAQEIDGNYRDDYCKCCDMCMDQCAMDI